MSPDTVARLIEDGEPYRFITPTDPESPVLLSELGGRAPYGLWTRGHTDQLTGTPHKTITFDGARAATAYGEEVTKVFAADPVHSNYTNVSGGALGIQGAAPPRRALRRWQHDRRTRLAREPSVSVGAYGAVRADQAERRPRLRERHRCLTDPAAILGSCPRAGCVLRCDGDRRGRCPGRGDGHGERGPGY